MRVRTGKPGFSLAALVIACGLLLAGRPSLAAAPGAGGAANRVAARAEASDIQKGFLLKTIRHGDKAYRYVLYVPADYDESKSWPTILFLHGAGECGSDGLAPVAVGIGPALMFQSEKWPFLVLIPQKPERKDAWEQHDALLMAMLDETKAHYKVDTSRLYLTGLSQGGHGTWAVGAKHPDLWAAIAPICGYGNPEEFAEPLKAMPIWCFHGEADKTVPVKQSQDIVAAIKAAGGSPELTTYPGVDHNSWDKAYQEAGLADWFLKHKR